MFPMLRDRSLVPLSHQHHNALALCVLTDRSLATDTSEANISRLAARVVDRFEIEMRNHFELEEQILFPLLPDAAAPLIAEHRTLERIVDTLRTAPAEAALREFTGLLRSHVRKEESEFFELAQRTLPRETLDKVGDILDRRAVRVCL
jgi:hemerythrin-like domain-containing protein